MGHELHSDWKKGSKWTHFKAGGDGTVTISGQVLESVPPKKLALTWADCSAPEKTPSRVDMEIEKVGDMVRLTVVHSRLDDANMAGKISQGWPRVLSSMKSFLETGTALDTWAA